MYDAESGLYYNRHRYYDPEIWQYISPDPPGVGGGLRPQGYVHNPVGSVDPFGLAGCPGNTETRPDTYQGVKDASAYLKEQGVPREYRKQILESFDVANAKAQGRYLFETFPATRESLAVKPAWNQMTDIAQFKVVPGSTIIEGKAASQGIGLPGGQTQKYINDLSNLIRQ